MAERIGIVLQDEMNGWARVVTDRKGGCGGCHSSAGGCRTCLTDSRVESRVINPINARSGDLVKISLPAASVYQGAALFYLLPIAGLILGAFGGLWIGGWLGWGTSSGGIAGALAGLAASVWAVVHLGRSPGLSRKLTPAITAVVQSSGAPQERRHAGCCG